VLPQLPRLARRSWFADPAADGGLFRLGGTLPELDFGLLAAGAPKSDSLAAALVAADTAGLPSAAARLVARFREELARLREQAAGLGPKDLAIGASPAAYALAGRYTVVLAAAAAVGVHRERAGLDDLALVAVLDRLAQRLPGPSPVTPAERADAETHLYRRLLDHHDRNLLLDLTARPVPG
jgi:hypothetical protein